jgi:high-affinity nickel-transport protein
VAEADFVSFAAQRAATQHYWDVPVTELLGLLGQEGNLKGPGWAWLEKFNINTAGYVIVGVFVVTWAVALVVWRLGRIEQKWGGAPAKADACD